MTQYLHKHFFVSYNSADRLWAEWIAWQLKEAGYSVSIQAWHFRPGSNFVLEMQKASETAERTVAVFSPNYLKALYTQPEWAAAFSEDPTGEQGKLLPVIVRECELNGLLKSIININIVGQDESNASKALLDGVRRGPATPDTPSIFPGVTPKAVSEQPRFPSFLPAIWNVPRRNPFFTGRNAYFEQLHNALSSHQIDTLAMIHAISGLAGMGKTRIAIEYAHRYFSEYDAVLWAKANSLDALNADFTSIVGTNILKSL